MIVADGALEVIPFAALPVAGKPLVVGHELVFLPSAAVLGELRRAAAGRRKPARQLALFADPVFSAEDPRVEDSTAPAEGALAEASLQTLAGGRHAGRLRTPPLEPPGGRGHRRRPGPPIPGRGALPGHRLAADALAVTSGKLEDYGILHFATHGWIDSARPQLSALILSLVDGSGRPRDGFLRLYDIYGLELAADLVVLSGCRTALGREIRGEGLESLARAFFHAGASRVMASLWSVQGRIHGGAHEPLLSRPLRRPPEAGRGPADGSDLDVERAAIPRPLLLGGICLAGILVNLGEVGAIRLERPSRRHTNQESRR